MLRAVCPILWILTAERMAWLTKQCMNGGTVNCSLSTPGVVREWTDELGGCRNIPRENSSLALCVYICVCTCICVCVNMHRNERKTFLTNLRRTIVSLLGQTWLQLVFSALALHPFPDWGSTLWKQMVGSILLRNVKADPFRLTPWSTESSALCWEKLWGFVFSILKSL